MRYWDASGLVPAVLSEPTTGEVMRLLVADPRIVTWWATALEITSAVARYEREGALGRDALTQAWTRLADLRDAWAEIAPAEAVRRGALRLLRVHPLRTADALQLSAALTAAGGEAAALEFVTADRRLADAAEREGFRVIVPAA